MSNWTTQDGKVLWRHYPVRGADAKSFVPIDETWAKDAKHVYCQYSILKGADVSTFEVLNPLWARDRTTAYYTHGRIAEANASTFKALDTGIVPVGDGHDALHAGFATDGDSVFFYMMTIGKPSKLPKADSASFQVVGPRFGRDFKAAYFERFRIPRADPAGLSFLGGLYCTDGERVFHGTDVVVGAHADSFVVSKTDFSAASDQFRTYLRGEST